MKIEISTIRNELTLTDEVNGATVRFALPALVNLLTKPGTVIRVEEARSDGVIVVKDITPHIKSLVDVVDYVRGSGEAVPPEVLVRGIGG